jgi:hypothetical protein
LDVMEEAYTTEHWIVRIYKVKDLPNRGVRWSAWKFFANIFVFRIATNFLQCFECARLCVRVFETYLQLEKKERKRKSWNLKCDDKTLHSIVHLFVPSEDALFCSLVLNLFFLFWLLWIKPPKRCLTNQKFTIMNNIFGVLLFLSLWELI